MAVIAVIGVIYRLCCDVIDGCYCCDRCDMSDR